MVIGPTPPGTGVMAAARFSASANSTSPQSLPSGLRFIPTSMTTAPGFTQAPFTISALPMAATRMSARPTSPARSASGSGPWSRWRGARGAWPPWACPRCWTGRRRGPASPSDPRRPRRAAASRRPACRARGAGLPSQSAPTFMGWKPSASLAGEMASSTLPSSTCFGQRQLHQDAVGVRVGVQPGDEGEQVGLADRGRRGGAPPSACPPPRRPCACRGRRWRRRGRRPPAPR